MAAMRSPKLCLSNRPGVREGRERKAEQRAEVRNAAAGIKAPRQDAQNCSPPRLPPTGHLLLGSPTHTSPEPLFALTDPPPRASALEPPRSRSPASCKTSGTHIVISLSSSRRTSLRLSQRLSLHHLATNVPSKTFYVSSEPDTDLKTGPGPDLKTDPNPDPENRPSHSQSLWSSSSPLDRTSQRAQPSPLLL